MKELTKEEKRVIIAKGTESFKAPCGRRWQNLNLSAKISLYIS